MASLGLKGAQIPRQTRAGSIFTPAASEGCPLPAARAEGSGTQAKGPPLGDVRRLLRPSRPSGRTTIKLDSWDTTPPGTGWGGGGGELTGGGSLEEGRRGRKGRAHSRPHRAVLGAQPPLVSLASLGPLLVPGGRRGRADEGRSSPGPWPSPIRLVFCSWGAAQQSEAQLPASPKTKTHPQLGLGRPPHWPQQAALPSPHLLNHLCRTFTWMLRSPYALATQLRAIGSLCGHPGVPQDGQFLGLKALSKLRAP